VKGEFGEDELSVVGLQAVPERSVGYVVVLLHPLLPQQPNQERLRHFLPSHPPPRRRDMLVG
jgi:hypothetical protein